jgi:uncharacterized protein YodC (DUF2158 family)
MADSFKVGDVVQLKSGGPMMTVEEVEERTVFCIWFDKTERKAGRFNPATLDNGGYDG